MKNELRTKRGVASFYIVAFSTLILLIIVVSFASLVVSEMTRSSNADLSQSAYDAALAGVEDAKLAYESYRNCKQAGYKALGGEPDEADNVEQKCGKIIYIMEQNVSCDMVPIILSREYSDEYGVAVAEPGGGNNLQQYYSCVKIESAPKMQEKNVSLYQATVFKPVFAGGVNAKDVKSIMIRWGDGKENEKRAGLSVTIVQTSDGFNLDSFTYGIKDGDNGRTNIGTVFLVPCQDGDDGCQSMISPGEVAKSNDKVVQNKEFKIQCDEGGEPGSCLATIQLPEIYLPETYDGEEKSRSNETFEIVITGFKRDDNTTESDSLSVQYCTGAEGECSEVGSGLATIRDQFVVDSTGRANDLYRRVRVTFDVEPEVEGGAIAGPLILGEGGLLKDVSVTTEYSNWGNSN